MYGPFETITLEVESYSVVCDRAKKEPQSLREPQRRSGRRSGKPSRIAFSSKSKPSSLPHYYDYQRR